MNLKSIKDLGDLTGKNVLVRVDWNVPVKEEVVVDDFRIKASLPTLEMLKEKGANVFIATHLEGSSVSVLRPYVPEGMTLLTNLRDNGGERVNDPDFAKYLTGGMDIYVNEAFSVSHREHASIVSVPRLLPSYVGLRFESEVENLSKAFNPKHPFLLILGGAKFETKLPLVEKFLNIADEIFIAGAMAVKVEGSLAQNPKIVLPLGDIAALDADAANINLLKEKIGRAEFILWNGPLGKYEDGYKEGTLALVQVLAESGKETIVGGADTLATIKDLNLYDKFTFVSTGGGAMLDFLANGTLPGIEALNSGTVTL